MASKPFYPPYLPDSAKSLPAQSGADFNAVPQSENRVYPASDLLKLSPTLLKDKMKSLVTFEEVTEDTDTKQDTKSDATVQNASDIETETETETTTDNAGQATTERKTVKLETVEKALGNEIAEGGVVTADPPSSAAADVKPKEESSVATGGTTEGEKKKKKKKKSKRTNPDGTLKPPKAKASGFEEFYCEGPIHPDVYAEEVNTVYHRSRNFAERIEICVFRYKERRKLNSTRMDMLQKYLAMGGIDTTIGGFQGGKEKPKDDSDSDDDFFDYDGPNVNNVTTSMQQMGSAFDTSQRGITKYYNPFAPQNWRVDWVGCASAFLSDRAIYLFGLDDETINEYTEVIVNFLNYVLMHNAAPEYTSEILETQKIARRAKIELKKVRILSDIFPGPFHRALSILTDGHQKLVYLRKEEDTEAERREAAENEDDFDEDKHFTIAKSKSTIQAAVQILGTLEQIKLLAELKEGDSIKVIKGEALGFEIVGITLPTEEQLKEFEAMIFESGPVKPMGFLHVRPWINEKIKIHYDMTPSEARAEEVKKYRAEKERKARLARGEIEDVPTETFIVSCHVLEHCVKGMKFECKVMEVVGGVRFIDEITKIVPSYYEVIDNEKMLSWREPKKTDRHPPTCEDKKEECERAQAGGEGIESGEQPFDD